MALVLKDRVKVSTTTTGTSSIALGSAQTGYDDFSVIGDGNTTYYTISTQGSSEWEVGIGTYTAAGPTLSRDTILASSNSGSVVNLSAGTKDVFVTYPAERSVNTADIGTTVQAYDADTTKNDVANTFTANQTINADLTVDTNTLYVDSTNNRVGIGTTSPQSKLDIEVGSAGAPTYKGKLRVFSNSTSADSGIELFTSSFGSGFGTRLETIDEGSGQTPFVIQNRQNSATWTERMRITSGGNVGIGTSSPLVPLHVESTGTSTSAFGNVVATFRSQAAGRDTSIQFSDGTLAGNIGGLSGNLVLGNGGNERMRIDSSGNVGIGTTSPYQAKLDVQGINGVAQYAGSNSNLDQILIGSVNRGVTPAFSFLPTGSSFVGSIGNGVNTTLGIATFGAASVVFGTSNAERMRIDSSGNVGIGTSSPNEKLEVNGAIRLLPNGGEGGELQFINVANNAVGAVIDIDGSDNYRIYNFSNTATVFYTNSAERMRITSSGNVGIGTSAAGYGDLTVLRQATTATNATLSLVSGTSAYGRLFFGDTQNAAGEYDGFIQYDQANRLMQFGTAQTERMRIDSSGNLLFNSGYGSVQTAYGCRAWVLFDGGASPTVNGSGGVSSVVQVSSGVYGITLANAMPDIYYVITNCGWTGGQNMIAQENDPGPHRTTTYFEVVYETAGGTKLNNTYNSVTVLR